MDDDGAIDEITLAKSQRVSISIDFDSSNGNGSGPIAGSGILSDEAMHDNACNNETSCQMAFKPIDDSNDNPFHSHHYHYIEYPGMYYQTKKKKKKKAKDDNVATSNSTYHYCVCSCSSNDAAVGALDGISRIRTASETQLQEQPPPQQTHQHESRLAVAAIVHHQSIDAKHQSQQSLLSHSYQMLNIPTDKTSDSNCNSKLNINCDLDGNCDSATCSCTAQRSIRKLNENLADSILAGADEITVSESDNNGTLTKRKNMRDSRVQKKINSWYAKNYNCNHIETYSDGDGDGDEADSNHRNDAVTPHGSITNIIDQRPPLPPRPAPVTAVTPQSINSTLNTHRAGTQSIKKYVIWCLVCGGFSCLLGALFLGVYFLLHSYTITVGNFETVPTFVPATLLILTGLCIISLARRKNRYSYLIKLSGACGLISALTCALVTVTTTVLHMSRLQALRECEYAQKTRTCTCYSDMIESQVDRVDKEGVRLVFDSLSDCGVVHGSLYSCLRAIFGLSVAGVLVAVFSCMLVYQLLSHERKKMYWEQLELRCRSLYTTHHHQHQHPHQMHTSSAHNMAALANIGARSATMCRCCEQCHAHRQLQLQTTAAYPWVDDAGEPRFWAGQPPGNFYSPNPGGEENHAHGHNTTTAAASNRSRISTGWSWPRMPWQRSSAESNNRFRQIPSSPDSQYGFSSTNPASLGMTVSNVAVATATAEEDAAAAAVAAVAAATATQRVAQAYNIVTGANGNALPYGIWGPPPPYSDPNSPARRGYYQYMQPTSNLCTANRVEENIVSAAVCDENTLQQQQQQRLTEAATINSLTVGSVPNVGNFDHISQRICSTDQSQSAYKSKEQNTAASINNDFNDAGGNTGSESDIESATTRFNDRFSNTLPTRKMKKRIAVDGSSSIAKCVGSSGGRHQLSSTHRINVQRVFPNSSNSINSSENYGDGDNKGDTDDNINSNARPLNSFRNGKSNIIASSKDFNGHISRQHCSNDILEQIGCINNGDANDINTDSPAVTVISKTTDAPYEDPTESEIYFADVSSCCNVSMKNDNFYEETYRNIRQYRASLKQHHEHFHHSHSHGHQHYQKHQQHQKQQHQQQQEQRTNFNQSNVGGCCLSTDFHQGSIRSRHSYLHPHQAESYAKKPNRIALQTSYVHNEYMKDNMSASSGADIKMENGMTKDVSLHSMCSNESEAKTECTDLSPLTPCSNKTISTAIIQCDGNMNSNSNKLNSYTANMPKTQNVSTAFSDFIASFPYSSSSETKFHEAQRRLKKHMQDNLVSNRVAAINAADDQNAAHYEIINDDNNKTLSMRVHPSTMSVIPHQQRSSRMVMHTRNAKLKENSDSVWSNSDDNGDVHHRQRL